MRRRLWNYGRIPTLWVITPDSIRIYDAFARPLEAEQSSRTKHLLCELSTISQRLQGVGQIHKRHFDDGSFWHTGYGRGINARQRVDESLLRDLQDTESLLCDDLSPSTAHALLCQTVFVKYLEDRHILRPHDFRRHGNASTFKELLDDILGTSSLFRWLSDKFNGDLFAEGNDILDDVTPEHLAIVRTFLSGALMKGYPATQLRLWPYSFQMVPIELISSIYEMFAHSANPDSAKARSVHYTKLGLVNMVLSLAMEDVPSTGRILDPACGSGVFLVEAFRRLAWSKAQQLGRPLNGHELRDMLSSQIFGMDIDRDAVYVTAFSLYLALLELEPLTDSEKQLKLPKLISDSPTDQSKSLYVQDFFNTDHTFNQTPPFAGSAFDLIISNPPWKALRNKDAPTDPDYPGTGKQWGLEYTTIHHVPDRKPDQGFLLRARDFTSASTTIAMITASRLFHQTSSTGRQWRTKFFETNTLQIIVDLSDLVTETLLFGGGKSTRLAASVLIFSPQPPNADSSFQHIAPKWYPGVRRRNELIVTSADVRYLLQEEATRASFWWKSVSYGLPRDRRLLDRLSKCWTLAHILDRMEIRSGVTKGRGVSLGSNPARVATHLQGIPYLSGETKKARFSMNVRELPKFSEPRVAKRSTNLILGLPALTVSRALVDRRPGVCLIEPYKDLTKIVPDQSYYGISFSDARRWLARRLNAILNSEFALYWIFMTGSDLGVGVRNLVEATDWESVPMPMHILEQDNAAWEEVLGIEEELSQMDSEHLGAVEHQRALDQAVYGLYELSDQDIVQIRDTALYTIDRFLSRNRAGRREPASEQLLSDYARRICTQLNDILRFAGYEVSAIICDFPTDAPLQACRFTTRRATGQTTVSRIPLPDEDALLAQISESLRHDVSVNLSIRQDLRVYDEGGFWIIKPAENRLWTEAAALSDADLIVAEHLAS